MERRAGSGKRGWRRPLVEVIAKDRGCGNDFRTIDWPWQRRKSVSKVSESGIHQENWSNRVARSGSCLNPRRQYDSRVLVLLDRDFLVVQIIGHGDDKKQYDQGAAHRHDLPPMTGRPVRTGRGVGQASA